MIYDEAPDYSGLEVRARSLASGEPAVVSSLCGSCRFGLSYRRRGETEVAGVFCTFIGRSVPTDIEECSRYRNIKEMDMMEMMSIAKMVDGRMGIHEKSYR